jgi:Nif-specific regulatory protein
MIEVSSSSKSESESAADLLRLQQERDLYLALLRLGDEEHPEDFVKRALKLAVQVFDADRGYLEISDTSDVSKGTNTWCTSVGCGDDEIARYRHGISSGIVALAFAQGRALRIHSAFLDPAWRSNQSVRLNNIGAVLCAPIGVPALGVIYLQGRSRGGGFHEKDEELLQLLAKHLLPLCTRLFHRNAVAGRDPTAPFRSRLKLDGLVGSSAALGRLLRNVELYAPLDMTLLITGESGTGKTEVARAVHDNSPRRGGPFVAVNMPTLDSNLFTAAIFGHERGAFTGADRVNAGFIAAAEGGTLFMDEIGDISLEAQTKLLQFLQSKTYSRLGSTEPLKADVRIIAATNADLQLRVAERRFRAGSAFAPRSNQHSRSEFA